MKHDFSRALKEHVKGDFNLLRELDGAGRTYLATAVADGVLAILVLHSTQRGELELEEIRQLSAAHPVGSTVCWKCTRVSPGWPRFCPGCANDLSGVSAAETEAVERVKRAVHRQWPGARLLGSIPYAAGGGAMHFVQRPDGGAEQGHGAVPVAGIVMDAGEKDADVLVPRWAMDTATLERFRGGPAAAVVQPVRADPPVPSSDSQDVPAGGGEAPGRRVPALGWAAAVLLIVALAFVPLIRRSAGSPIQLPISDTATATVVSLMDSTRDTSTVVPAPADTAPRPVQKSRTKVPARTPEPVIVQDTFAVPEPLPDPEADRRQVIAAARNFATAFGTQDIARVRSAYPGMTPQEETGWREWFGRGFSLSAGFVVQSGPELHGDSARMEFTLPLRYSRQRQCMAYGGLDAIGRHALAAADAHRQRLDGLGGRRHHRHGADYGPESRLAFPKGQVGLEALVAQAADQASVDNPGPGRLGVQAADPGVHVRRARQRAVVRPAFRFGQISLLADHAASAVPDALYDSPVDAVAPRSRPSCTGRLRSPPRSRVATGRRCAPSRAAPR
mgnify:CR=1 FL=1